jgi:hypothetical protein
MRPPGDAVPAGLDQGHRTGAAPGPPRSGWTRILPGRGGASAAQPAGAAKPSLQLFALSFLMLLAELVLIKWIGANISYLSYFSNFVMLGSVLGTGIGFLRARAAVNLFPWTPLALALLVLYVLAFPAGSRSGPAQYLSPALRATGPPAWVALPVIFLGSAAVMMLIAEGAARAFVQFPPLDGYRIEVLGSIAGIGVFAALSLADAPPLGWGLVIGIVLAAVLGRSGGAVQWAALLGLAAMLAAESIGSHDIWSPYAKITVALHGQHVLIRTNGLPASDIGPAAHRRPVDELPYRQAPANPLRDVLVIGPGTGSDVATALRLGARHVDAVGIDPALQQVGRQLNPDRPYQDHRVSTIVADGRAFLDDSRQKYNLILYALPNQLAPLAGQSSLRLGSYLFTLQGMQAARARLAASGVFALSGADRAAWLRDRLANTMDLVYGHAPCSSASDGSLMLTISDNPAVLRCARMWRRPAQVLAPATDDRPFVYVHGSSLPVYYVVTVVMILLVSVLSVRAASGPVTRMTKGADLFCMGAAFLLLETRNLAEFALLFGATWVVNALVFAGVLVTALAAVQFSRRVVLRRQLPLYLTLIAALLAAWLIPAGSLLALPRLAAAIAIAFVPVLIANVAFAQRFKTSADAMVALGANLLGSMAGGLLEYTSLIFGYRWLLAGVAALYCVAYLVGRARPGRWRPYPGAAPRHR